MTAAPATVAAGAGASAGAAPERLVRKVRRVLEQVADPEIPVLTIADLGVLRDVTWEDGRIQAVITPTYSGCPAMQTIEQDMAAALEENDCGPVEIVTRLSPAWTTDWLSAAGREKLLRYGIAPPAGAAGREGARAVAVIACPRCRSTVTERISEFGSTPCKALYRCQDCREPFDYFKCL